jgi:hypothetical protein
MRDAAEWVAVHRLIGRLESMLDEPLDPAYAKLIDAAGDRLRRLARPIHDLTSDQTEPPPLPD